MQPDELKALRERSALSVEAVAALLGVTERKVSAWEAGSVSMPRREAAKLAWHGWNQERDRAHAAASLRPYPWVLVWDSRADNPVLLGAIFPALGVIFGLVLGHALFRHFDIKTAT